MLKLDFVLAMVEWMPHIVTCLEESEARRILNIQAIIANSNMVWASSQAIRLPYPSNMGPEKERPFTVTVAMVRLFEDATLDPAHPKDCPAFIGLVITIGGTSPPAEVLGGGGRGAMAVLSCWSIVVVETSPIIEARTAATS